jgi:hypothetical protein
MKKLNFDNLIAAFDGKIQLGDGSIIEDKAILQKAFDAVDQDAIRAKIKEQYVAEEWDRKTPINGNAASKVLLVRKDIPINGKVYTISRGGKVMFFQPFKPGLPGHQPMTTEAEMRKCMEAHLNQVIDGQLVHQARMAFLINLQGLK